MEATKTHDAPSPVGDASPRLRLEVVDALFAAKKVASKTEQARRLDLTRTHWARIRSGEVTPTLRHAMNIAQVLGTSVEALFGRTR